MTGLADPAAGALGRLTDIINRNPEAVTAMATAVIGAVGAYNTASRAIDAGRFALESYQTAAGAVGKLKSSFDAVAEGYRLVASGAGTAAEVANLSREAQIGAGAFQAKAAALKAASAATVAYKAVLSATSGALGSFLGVLKANPLMAVVGALALAGAALVTFFTQTETGRQMWQQLMQAIQPALNTILPLIGQLGEKIIQSLQPALQIIMPALQRFAEMAGQVFGQVVQSVQPVIERLIPLIGSAIQALLPILGQMGAALMESLGQIGQHLAPLIPDGYPVRHADCSGVVAYRPATHDSACSCARSAGSCGHGDASADYGGFPSAGEMLLQLVPVFGQIVAVVVDLGTQVLAALLPAIQALLPVLATIIGVIAGVVVVLVTSLIPVFASVVQAIVPLITTLIDILVPAIQAVLNVVTTVVQAIVPIVQGALDIVVGIIKTVTAIIKGDWSAAWKALSRFSPVFGKLSRASLSAQSISSAPSSRTL